MERDLTHRNRAFAMRNVLHACRRKGHFAAVFGVDA
jgi:hypothetical protein